jgi:hypothetical protein
MKTFATKAVHVGTRLVVAPLLLLIGGSCTNLTETPHDALTPENAFHTDAEILAGVAGIYAALRPQDNNVGYMSVEEVTTDELIVPTRGSDWFDNGQWLEMHRQTWSPNSAGAGTFLNSNWNDIFGAIAKENLMIEVVAKAGGCDAALATCASAKSDTTLAELRTLRAWDYYMLQNWFGGVPLVTTTELKQYPRSTRSEVFAFIEKELVASVGKLPDKWPAEFYGRVTKGAAYAILASLYLNAGVFNKNTGVSASAYNSCASVTIGAGTACAAAITAATAVLNLGTYTLATNWADNFSLTNKSSPENIFVIVHSKDQNLGGNWPMRTLHYNQLNNGWGGPWNGFATTAEAFSNFTPTDDRRAMWLVGQAYSFETGLPVNDRTNKPLIFTTAIPDAQAADEAQGVRFNKFPPLPSGLTGNGHPNDFTIFRLAEMYLIRAEAENEAGQTAAALADLAVIHDRHDPANPVAAMGLATQGQIRAAILKERLLEFAAEGKRRADMVRMGAFLSWTEASKNGVSSTPRDAHLLLFPIPSSQIASNPLLTQNPGY